MKDLFKAKELLKNGHTCVLCKDDSVITTNERGVMPLVEWIDEGKVFTGYSVADKVIGKAAALLYVTLGVKKVYTPVLSQKASDVFEEHQIEYWYDTLTQAIINRKGDGFCPMETVVKTTDDPEEALKLIKNKLNEI